MRASSSARGQARSASSTCRRFWFLNQISIIIKIAWRMLAGRWSQDLINFAKSESSEGTIWGEFLSMENALTLIATVLVFEPPFRKIIVFPRKNRSFSSPSRGAFFQFAHPLGFGL